MTLSFHKVNFTAQEVLEFLQDFTDPEYDTYTLDATAMANRITDGFLTMAEERSRE